MPTKLTLFLPLIVASLLLIVLFGIGGALDTRNAVHRTLNNEVSEKMRKSDQKVAFACGYVYGQRELIKAAGLQMKLPEPTEGCPALRDLATANGFHTGNDDH